MEKISVIGIKRLRELGVEGHTRACEVLLLTAEVGGSAFEEAGFLFIPVVPLATFSSAAVTPGIDGASLPCGVTFRVRAVGKDAPWRV